MESAKEDFLKQFGEFYGYPGGEKSVEEIRASEFKRLEGLVYLDHAGATLYSDAQIEAVAKDFTSNIYGNPHSQSESSMATSDIISRARRQVLELCNASSTEYACIFTSGATAGLKIIGESFPWSEESCYAYTVENHNSVLGIREYALDHGSRVMAVDIEDSKLHNGFSSSFGNIDIEKYPVQRRTAIGSSERYQNGEVFNLFAFPSECNFTGRRFHLDLVQIMKEKGGEIIGGSTKKQQRWLVLIDASKGCSTEPPNLSKFPADFVVFSFYKIFGYPTGLGALIVHHDAAKWLKKTYFSGGTVLASMATNDFVKRREKVEQLFEDGTLPFLSISSIFHGLKIINSLTMRGIERHTASIATFMRKTLLKLRHSNGVEVCVLYGKCIPEMVYSGLGPTISFNLKRPDDTWFGYREVEKLATLSGIQLRTGCFCNPGACAKYLGLSHSDIMSNLEAGHVCWDDNDILNGKPTGAVRISFGYMSVFEDAWKFLKFVENSFVSRANFICEVLTTESKEGCLQKYESRDICISSIAIYPVKSCAGFSVDRWPLCSTGLRYDREWLIKSPRGEVLTQKKVLEMSKVSTFIDLNQKMLILESPNCVDKLQIPLEPTDGDSQRGELDVYGQRFGVQEYGNKVNQWLSLAISRPCFLIRRDFKFKDPMNKEITEAACRDATQELNFVNEAQLLLISSDSIGDLNNRIKLKCMDEKNGITDNVSKVDSARFRPNLVISRAQPYAEDTWRSLQIGTAHFTSLGGCNRCQMINLDPVSGKSREPLATLASFRRRRGQILFGILLRYEEAQSKTSEKIDDEIWIQVGQAVYPHAE
ncbi:molybdenum cofactor sulfurase (LOS5) (ABA3) isoform X2 [Wolffia australiana]